MFLLRLLGGKGLTFFLFVSSLIIMAFLGSGLLNVREREEKVEVFRLALDVFINRIFTSKTLHFGESRVSGRNQVNTYVV